MQLGCRLIFLFFWLYCIFVVSLVLFTKGFLLKRIQINNSSKCEQENWTIRNLWNGITKNYHLNIEHLTTDETQCLRDIRPKFKKAVFIVIDGLRHDFLEFNSELKNPLPYQNKMKKLHQILTTEPRNGKLYKFEADPPTTTMQRIKGMTTGSLPTFIDAGSNFNSYEITEDNILDQALRQGKNISFMGCSTWTELFKKHFHRKIPYSALNVKDLDTIDYGIMKHLIPEVKREDWALLIAHFLGVDHCGHRYGTNHGEMTRKLTEMDNVISGLVENIDNDTVLFVMGDHGMTISGDHGGDSKDEVMAGLFAYSKRSLFTPPKKGDELAQVSQIDLVPTLSLLLDQPIPFSNLGSVIPDFYNGQEKNFQPDFIAQSNIKKKYKNLSSRLFKHINLAYSSYLNCKQILLYLNEYQAMSGDLPADKLIAAKSAFEFSEEKFEDNLKNLIEIEWLSERKIDVKEIEEAIVELNILHEQFSEFLSHIKSICRTIWAKFDLVSIAMGLTLMLTSSVMAIFSPLFIKELNIRDESFISIILNIAGIAFALVAIVYLALPFTDVEMSSFVSFIAVSFSFTLWLLSIHSNLRFIPFKRIMHVLTDNLEPIHLIPVLFMMHMFSLFSNSYIVFEDSVTLYFLNSSILLITLVQIGITHRQNLLRGQRKMYSQLKSKVTQSITSPENMKIFAAGFVCMVGLRWTNVFWFCREMQLKCVLSTYALPIAFLLTEYTDNYGNERILLAVASLVAIVIGFYYYLKKTGAFVGKSLSIILVKSLLICAGMISVHWVFQLVLRHEIARLYDLGYIQQIILPRVVYFIVICVVISLSYNPSLLHIVYRSHRKSFYENGNDDIASIYNALREEMSSNGELEKPPVVYGLHAVYSNSFIALLFAFVVVTSMLLTDGMTFPFLLMIISGASIIVMMSNIMKHESSYVLYVIIMMVWSYSSWAGFFGTSHQTALPTIKYQTAYIGFHGSLPEMVPQIIVLVWNTFSSQILHAMCIPLISVLIWRSSDVNQREVDLVNQADLSRMRLFKMMLSYLCILMIRVSFAASSAALHRRHLMVWKIFAPRFLFECVQFAVIGPVLLLTFMYFLRIDNSLRLWLHKLEEHTK